MHSTPLRSAGDGRASHPSRRWGLLALAGSALVLSGCGSEPVSYGFGAYKSATETGQDTYHLWQWFSIGAVVIGTFTLALIAWAAIRYRASKKALADGRLPRQTQYHLPLEVTYTIVPILIVFALFAGTVVVENKVTAMPTPATSIRVFAFQWGWQFTYPAADTGGKGFSIQGQNTQTPVMVMPSNVNVRISLQSVDVVHGFYVKEFNFSRYALPGVVNLFTFHPVQNGEFFGQCTQLCGLQHSIMFFKVRVVSPEEYRRWLADEERQAPRSPVDVSHAAVLSQLNPGVPVVPAVGVGVN